MTKSRHNYFQFLQKEIEHLNSIESRLDQSSLGPKLIELVKLRVSQINGCSFCVSLHTQRLRLLDETGERIDLVVAWREAPCFSPSERVVLKWAEAVTRLADSTGIGDELYEEAVEAIGEEGISQLTLAIGMVNLWNRIAVSFHTDHQFVAQILKSTK